MWLSSLYSYGRDGRSPSENAEGAGDGPWGGVQVRESCLIHIEDMRYAKGTLTCPGEVLTMVMNEADPCGVACLARPR